MSTQKSAEPGKIPSANAFSKYPCNVYFEILLIACVSLERASTANFKASGPTILVTPPKIRQNIASMIWMRLHGDA